MVTLLRFWVVSLSGLCNNSTKYTLDENTFSGEYDPQLIPPSISFYDGYGLYINNSGSMHNMVYKNEFYKLEYASSAANIHRDFAGEAGLVFKCNHYWDNYQDIIVTWEGSQMLPEYGIAYYQGSYGAANHFPGNRFSQIATGHQYSDYENLGHDFIYYLPSPSSQIDYPTIVPKYYTTNSIDIPISIGMPYWSPESGCESYLNSKSSTELNSLVESNDLTANEYADSLTMLVDEGNTSAMNLDVQTATSNETMEVREDLLDASPYLSDTVMSSAIKKEDVLPNAIITEILVANPQAAKSDDLLEKLDERDNPPSDSQMDLILANDSIISDKERLESMKSYFQVEKHRNVNQLVRLYRDEYRGSHTRDSLENTVVKLDAPFGRYQKALSRFSAGDSLGVANTLISIPTDFDLSDKENDIHSYYNDYFDILLKLQSENKSLPELSENQKSVLYDIMDNAVSTPQVYARNVLIHADNFAYKEPYIKLAESDKQSVAVFDRIEFKTKLDNNNCFNIYPNPALDYLTIEYELEMSVSKFSFLILDLKGNPLKSIPINSQHGIRIVDVKNWVPGT